MDLLLFTVMPAALIGTALWRIPAAIHSGRAARSLCLTTGLLGLSLLCTNPAISGPIHHMVPNLPVLLRHLLTLASATYLLDYLDAVHADDARSRLRPGLPLLAASAAAMTAIFFLLLPRGATPKADDVITQHLGEIRTDLYMAITYAYLGLAMISGTRTFWHNRRSVPRGLARTGTTLLAAGCATGALYTAWRLIVMTLAHIGAPETPAIHQVGDILALITLVLIATGLTLPPLRTFARYCRDQRNLWRIHPLWADIAEQFPHLVLGERPRSRARELFTLGDRTIDVSHAAFTVRDGFLSLAPWAAPDATRAATVGADAMSEALWAKAALTRKAGNDNPAVPDIVLQDQQLRGPTAEIRWAAQVATYYSKATS
ncbi:MAB_1171c family putative transporter [Kitasatospora sp. NPDC093679]|uniref:MAB_1171c family putative transporter n=1 Tax=Kitasatospora sp. NPDC093679 TaxID=3154983 RepID=UPI0034207910